MTTTRLPSDFKEFLRLLNEHDVRSLIVGGYAVGYHGYLRSPMRFSFGDFSVEDRRLYFGESTIVLDAPDASSLRHGG